MKPATFGLTILATFDRADTNHDGLRLADRDGDKRLSRAELRNFMKALRNRR